VHKLGRVRNPSDLQEDRLRTPHAQDDRLLPLPHRLDAAEGKGTTPLQEQAASAYDDLVGVVGVLFVADVVEPTEVGAIACHHPVASRGGEQATELRLPPQALLCILSADPLIHGRRSVIRLAARQVPANGIRL